MPAPHPKRAEGMKLLAAGVSVPEVARRLGVSRSTARNWKTTADSAAARGGACAPPSPKVRRAAGLDSQVLADCDQDGALVSLIDKLELGLNIALERGHTSGIAAIAKQISEHKAELLALRRESKKAADSHALSPEEARQAELDFYSTAPEYIARAVWELLEDRFATPLRLVDDNVVELKR